ncbi:MAG: FAD-dependent oxidoreductase [Microthrixaceae bacterium]|nr:FAD-dependent oxidoreductase [Microthrixaceae bacterium]
MRGLPNPFATVCGRVCAAPCEDACRRGQIDRPIAIRALKRFVTEQYGTEAGVGETWERVAAPPAAKRPETIGIVGGGPAGMACAHDLARFGYSVTVYEATDRLGGAMWLGIPEYRLDRDVLKGDIDAILNLGVEVEYNTRLGVDVTLSSSGRATTRCSSASGPPSGVAWTSRVPTRTACSRQSSSSST